MTRAPVHDLLLAATEAEGKVMTGAWHLAQFNVAKLVAPKGDLRVQPFFDAIERVNALAEASPASSGACRTRAATPPRSTPSATRC